MQADGIGSVADGQSPVMAADYEYGVAHMAACRDRATPFHQSPRLYDWIILFGGMFRLDFVIGGPVIVPSPHSSVDDVVVDLPSGHLWVRSCEGPVEVMTVEPGLYVGTFEWNHERELYRSDINGDEIPLVQDGPVGTMWLRRVGPALGSASSASSLRPVAGGEDGAFIVEASLLVDDAETAPSQSVLSRALEDWVTGHRRWEWSETARVGLLDGSPELTFFAPGIACFRVTGKWDRRVMKPPSSPSARTYLRLSLRSDSVYEPVTLYRDVDSDGRDVRRLDVFHDGRCGYATADESWGGTELSNEAQGGAVVISREEFLAEWTTRAAKGPPVRAALAAPLTRDEATAVASQFVARLAVKAKVSLAIITERTMTRPYGWIFFYGAAHFVETGGREPGIGGNGPIVVERVSGKIHQLGTGLPVDEMIAAFERGGAL